MRDQAEKLRFKMENPKLARSIGVVSGKGGVGKSNFSANFSYNLADKGNKVLIVDMDIGMGNINILLGKNTRRSLMDYLVGNCALDEVIDNFRLNIDYVSGGSAMTSIIEWNELMFERLISAFETLQQRYDYIVFDMGAGATEWSLQLLEAIDDIVVISTTEPTSIMDAYSMVKYIHMRNRSKNMYVVCNRSISSEEGRQALKRLKNTASHFLQKELHILGAVPEDIHVRKAVQQQQIFSILYDRSPATKAIQNIVDTYVNGLVKQLEDIQDEPNKLIHTLKNIFKKGRG